MLEGKERDQTEEIRKQCQGGFRYGNKKKKKKKHANALDSSQKGNELRSVMVPVTERGIHSGFICA